MGYKNRIRAMLPEAEFNQMDSKLKELDDEMFYDYDFRKYRTENIDLVKKNEPAREPVRYVYFGWNWISWNEEVEGFASIVMEAIYESENCHYIRCGAELNDIEEICMLTGYVDRIYFRREFNDVDGFDPDEKNGVMEKYIVCMDSSYVRDSQMFNMVGLSKEEFDQIDLFSEENGDRWHDMEPTPFIAVIDAKTDKEACIMAAEKYRYDVRCLFAQKITIGKEVN